MSIIRQDLSTKDWTIFALERAKRPKDFSQKKRRKSSIRHSANCPFCKGNEDKTPKELFRVSNDGSWLIRVVPNKYPALSSREELNYSVSRHIDGPYLNMEGIGSHEVIIESPRHNDSIAFMEKKHLEKVLLAYKQRYVELSKNENYQLIIIFRNHGARAGTSLEHPHSQLIATPFVPAYVRNKLYESQRYFDDFGNCVYCDMIKNEIQSEKRMVYENDKFISFCPYASVVPYHTLILPKKHQSCFAEIDDSSLEDLADILKKILMGMDKLLGDPDYNYVIDSAPPDKSGAKHYHWHLEILPRLTTRAGFEIGSGMYINTILPEDCASSLRKS